MGRSSQPLVEGTPWPVYPIPAACIKNSGGRLCANAASAAGPPSPWKPSAPASHPVEAGTLWKSEWARRRGINDDALFTRPRTFECPEESSLESDKVYSWCLCGIEIVMVSNFYLLHMGLLSKRGPGQAMGVQGHPLPHQLPFLYLHKPCSGTLHVMKPIPKLCSHSIFCILKGVSQIKCIIIYVCTSINRGSNYSSVNVWFGTMSGLRLWMAPEFWAMMKANLLVPGCSLMKPHSLCRGFLFSACEALNLRIKNTLLNCWSHMKPLWPEMWSIKQWR